MKNTFLYNFKYDVHHAELCKLESRQLFNSEPNERVILSHNSVSPSISPFIRNRIEILAYHGDYEKLLANISNLNLCEEGFKVEYVVLDQDLSEREEKRSKLKDIGYSINAVPNFKTPTITYGLCKYKNTWYFGILTAHQTKWLKHNDKPYSFSSSICMKIAKSLVAIATVGDKSKSVLDACCGVGTIMLEACISNVNIEGSDINPKTCAHARLNLEHYDYVAKVNYSDVKDISSSFDAVIVDLPYNLYSYSDDSITRNIIQSASKLGERVIIVSTADISPIINEYGLKKVDSCKVDKRGKGTFSRTIWVCSN